MGNTQPKEKREDAPTELVVRLKPEVGSSGRRHEIMQVLSLEDVRVCRRKEAQRKSEVAQKAAQKDHNMKLIEIQKMFEEDWQPENLTHTLNPSVIVGRFQAACCGSEQVIKESLKLDHDEYHKLDPSELKENEFERLEEQKRISERFESIKRKSLEQKIASLSSGNLKVDNGNISAAQDKEGDKPDAEKEGEAPGEQEGEELPEEVGDQEKQDGGDDKEEKKE